jgi:hypothetical protein
MTVEASLTYADLPAQRVAAIEPPVFAANGDSDPMRAILEEPNLCR